MFYKNCKNFFGDEDCGRCAVFGFILRCPYDCPVPDSPSGELKMDAEETE